MRSNRLVLIVVCGLLCFTACSRRPRVVTAPPPPPSPAATSMSALDQADRAFGKGAYEEAAQGYETYLRVPSGTQRDQALFRLGLTYVLRPTPAADWQKASSVFKELADQHPNSPLKPAADLILALRAEVDQVTADGKQRDQRLRQLTAELDRLKKIDADRRKRP